MSYLSTCHTKTLYFQDFFFIRPSPLPHGHITSSSCAQDIKKKLYENEILITAYQIPPSPGSKMGCVNCCNHKAILVGVFDNSDGIIRLLFIQSLNRAKVDDSQITVDFL